LSKAEMLSIKSKLIQKLQIKLWFLMYMLCISKPNLLVPS